MGRKEFGYKKRFVDNKFSIVFGFIFGLIVPFLFILSPTPSFGSNLYFLRSILYPLFSLVFYLFNLIFEEYNFFGFLFAIILNGIFYSFIFYLVQNYFKRR